MSLITYFLRDFSELMHSYEDVVAKNVHSLIQSCPIESISTRKELLVDFRHILATDFRKGFAPYLDSFLDETFLMGPGRHISESLRPLVFLTIADVVHHTRDNLNFSQLSRVVFLFSKNLHDSQLTATIQTTSVRILISVTERFSTTHYDQATLYHRDRKLMKRMLKLLALKFSSLREYIPIIEFNQARQLYIESENIADYCGPHSSLKERLEVELLSSGATARCSRDDIYISGNANPTP